MNDLTTTQAKPLAKTASDECSPELWRLLTNARLSWAEAVQTVRDEYCLLGGTTPHLLRVATQLARHIEPCGAKVVVGLLAPLLSLYGVSDKSEGEAKAFWGFYIDALSGLPAEALRAGIAEYVADPKSEFFPKPGPLKGVCERHAIPLRMAANRVAKALS